MTPTDNFDIYEATLLDILPRVAENQNELDRKERLNVSRSLHKTTSNHPIIAQHLYLAPKEAARAWLLGPEERIKHYFHNVEQWINTIDIIPIGFTNTEPGYHPNGELATARYALYQAHFEWLFKYLESRSTRLHRQNEEDMLQKLREEINRTAERVAKRCIQHRSKIYRQ